MIPNVDKMRARLSNWHWSLSRLLEERGTDCKMHTDIGMLDFLPWVVQKDQNSNQTVLLCVG